MAVDTSGVLAGKTVVAIAAGDLHSMALCSDGTVVASSEPNPWSKDGTDTQSGKPDGQASTLTGYLKMNQ